jgi:glyoxylase-like metal-dependent hydrolase (beta-lactamase superfamily II)
MRLTNRTSFANPFTLAAVLLGSAAANGESLPEKFAPLPEQARPQPDTAEGYRLQKVGKGAHVVIAGPVQTVFVVTTDGVVLIDAPPRIVDKVQHAIASVTDKPVTHLIYSHSHHDHIGGAAKFPNAIRIAERETARTLDLSPDPDRPPPTETFTERKVLKVGGEEIRLIDPGPNHQTGNIIIHVPTAKLVVLMDVLWPGWVPYRGWGNADSIPGILRAHDEVLKLDFDTYVGGHVYRTGTRADVETSREFVRDLWNETGNAMTEVAFADSMSTVEPGNVWAAQTVWFDRIADKVMDSLAKKWRGKLAGFDTFTHDTIIAVIVSRATDKPKEY